MRKLYVTGAEVLTSCGFGLDQLPPVEQLSCLAGTRIPELPPVAFGYKGLKRLSRPSRLSVMTIGRALEKSGLAQSGESGNADPRSGFLIGANHSNLDAIAALYEESQRYGPGKVNPGIFPETVLNVIGGYAAIYFRLCGANVTISNGRGTGSQILKYACDLLRADQLRRVVVALVDLLPPEHFAPVVQGSLPAYESIVALVLEGKQPTYQRRPLAVLEVSEDAAEGQADYLVQPECALIAVAAALRNLRTDKLVPIRLKVTGAREETSLITLSPVPVEKAFPYPAEGNQDKGDEPDGRR